MDKICSTCAYGKNKNCEILHEKVDNCFAWANEEEAKKREKAIIQYSGGSLNGNVPATKSLPKEQIEKRLITRLANAKNRDGKSVKQILDEHFNWYYEQDFTDEEIGLKLFIDKRRVSDYRNKFKLPRQNKKDRSAPTEAAM